VSAIAAGWRSPATGGVAEPALRAGGAGGDLAQSEPHPGVEPRPCVEQAGGLTDRSSAARAVVAAAAVRLAGE